MSTIIGFKILKVNQKAAESLADPEDYPNLFEDWHSALDIESRLRSSRFSLMYL